MTCPNPECKDERVIYDVQDISIPRMGIKAHFDGWTLGDADYRVIEPIRFCPFCGTALPVRAEEERDKNRCAVCGWPLAESRAKGCVRGDCSLRPRPKTLYDAARAAEEEKET